jgi:hypothetical protein
MADAIATAYPAVQGNVEQQYVQQQQFSYQAQVNNQGGQQFYAAAGNVDQQHIQDNADQQGASNQNQDVNYAQYTRSGAELANGQQIDGAAFGEQANAGIIQQYAGAAGQLSQQQGPNGYKINFDPNPQIIRKHANDAVTYKQEVAVRYLRPPTPPPPGPLIIKEVSEI